MHPRARCLPRLSLIALLVTAFCAMPLAADWQTAIAKFKNLSTFKSEVVGARGVVSSNHPLAASAGQLMMAKGGNAVDAIVATFFALSVVKPEMVSPFSSGFITLYTKDGRAVTVDNYTVAPAAAKPDMYKLEHPDNEKLQAEAGHKTVGDENTTGFKSIGVPGGLKAWFWLLKNHGSGNIPLREIMQPAIDYASNGFQLTPNVAGSTARYADRFRRFEGWSSEMMPNGQLPQGGSLFKRPAFALTLSALADAAPATTSLAEQLEAAAMRFYKGDIAKNIVTYVQANGGLLSTDDMAWYYGKGIDDLSPDQGLRVREPVRGTYRGYDIVTVPPTSGGGTQIVETLNILEGYDLKALGFGSPQTLHLMTEAMKIAWADRDAYMGDPDYAGKDPSYKYDAPPVSRLISKDYAASRRKEIDQKKPGTYQAGQFGTTPPTPLGQGSAESFNTTHATAMDGDGNVVSMTQTLNGLFGSGIALPGRVPGSGMLLNNTMALMDPDPRSGYERANAIAPRKRMLSTMSPTIVLKDGKPFMALGTPGGTFISAAVLQGILNVIDHGMNIQQAVEAPRIWTMMYGDLRLEEGIPAEVVDALKAMGHAITRTRTVAGGMNGVLLDRRTHLIHGGACWREDGSAAGWSGGDALPATLSYPPAWDKRER
jgi:gamma-glutamyltranspeptidase / glutathione hydrolase